MNHHTGQTSSNLDTHSGELQSVLTQQNKRLTRENLAFEVKNYQHQDDLNILLNKAKTTQISLFCSRATASPLITRENNTNFTNCFSFLPN